MRILLYNLLFLGGYMDKKKLTENAKQLFELDVEFINKKKHICDHNNIDIIKLLQKFDHLKIDIQKMLIEDANILIKNEMARNVILKINSKELFEAEKSILQLVGESVESIDEIQSFSIDEIISDEEMEQLEIDYFYSWISGHDYIKNLSEIGNLVLGTDIPDNLKQIVEEARKCLALEQYNAVYSLCRTILESCMRDISFIKDEIPEEDRNLKSIDFYNKHKIGDIINYSTSDETLRKDIRLLYFNGFSELIHGFKTVNFKIAKEKYHKTLQIISRLYKFV